MNERLMLWNLVRAYALVRRVFEAKRQRLNDLLDSDSCPERFLDGLATVVGFSDGVPITSHIEGESWRRIVDLAPDLFSSVGEHDAIRSAITALTGRRSSVGDWIGLVAVAGSAFPWFATGSIVDAGDWLSELHVETLGADPNTDLTRDTLSLVLGQGESLAVAFAEMVENWSSLFRWGVVGDGSATASGHALELDATGASGVSLDLVETMPSGDWEHVAFNAYVAVEAGRNLEFSVRRQANGIDRYRVVFIPGAGVLGGIRLYRSGTEVASWFGGFPASPNAVLVSVRTTPLVAGGLYLEVVLDGQVVAVYSDATPHPTGGVRWQVGPDDVASVLYFEVMPVNAVTLLVTGD